MVKPLDSYLRPPTRHGLRLWLAAAVLLVISAVLGGVIFRQHHIVAQAMARNERLRAAQAEAVPPTASRAEQEESMRWAHLKIERDFPWAQVFQAVERAGSPDIELLQFKPDKPNRRIALGGEARNRKALIAYLDALENQTGLKNVYLTHEQTVQRDALETIAFEIKASLTEPPL